jgi:hypothetical protein
MGKIGHKTYQNKFLPRDKMSQERVALLQGDEMSHHDEIVT